MAKAARFEEVAESIRQEITTGTHAEGAQLDVDELVKKHATTKATVGKALGALARDGLVRWDGEVATIAGGAATGDATETAEASPVPVITESAEELVAKMTARAEEKSAELAPRETPPVLEGRVITAHVDPDAERALKNPDVAQAYQEGKVLGQAWMEAEGRATEAKRALSHKLMDLRELFMFKGHPDYSGQSREYQALVSLLYQDLGVGKSGQRAILHHLEDRKRERVPKALWSKFGVEELSRGQRAGLEKKAAQALTSVAETAAATAGQAAKGKSTGHQLVTLAKRIDAGMAVFSTASLRVMTPAQRRTFVDQVREARDRADALIREAESLDE
ncbi:GntR family transcriptional regulator [Streptomyces netropsis]|uniref:GntR family transcriptional regulator n=1 Tax=Streptomyces netropsis TaxID=55404 RepID=UPI0030D25376